jgi:ERF superfamily
MKNDKQEIIEYNEKPVAIQDEAERLIAMAIDKNVPVESLERLLAMRDKLRAEKAEEAFDKAMAAFQAKCPTIEKTKQGYNYKYADLTAIVEQIKDLLADNGFSYTFDTDEAENAVIVYCKIKHIAGHKEVSKAKISHETTSKMNSSQQDGSSMTYGKRYALCNALGILTGDEDTDAATPKQNTQIKSSNDVKQEKEPKVAKDTCPECHAPSGRLHATKCSLNK